MGGPLWYSSAANAVDSKLAAVRSLVSTLNCAGCLLQIFTHVFVNIDGNVEYDDPLLEVAETFSVCLHARTCVYSVVA